MSANRKRIEYHEALSHLLPAQFAEVLLRLGINERFLSSTSAPQSIRASEVIQLLEQNESDGLSSLSQVMHEISWNSSCSKSEKIAETALDSHQDRAGSNLPRHAIGKQNNLIAIGPDVISNGEISGTHGRKWMIRLQEPFLVGNISSLIQFGSNFEKLKTEDKYVLFGNLGEGYELSMPPQWQKSNSDLIIEIDVQPRAPRAKASELGSDVALRERPNGKYSVELLSGNPKMIAGVARIPQILMTVLSRPKGVWKVQPESGSRVAEFYEKFCNTIHLANMLELEIARLSFISLYDAIQKQKYIPFDFIERVKAINILPEQPHAGWVEAELALDLAGYKEPWRSRIRFLIKT